MRLVWGGRSKTGTTFEKQKKLVKKSKTHMLKLLAAQKTWGKHPDELEGVPFSKYMLIDMMALEEWRLENTLG